MVLPTNARLSDVGSQLILFFHKGCVTSGPVIHFLRDVVTFQVLADTDVLYWLFIFVLFHGHVSELIMTLSNIIKDIFALGYLPYTLRFF